MPICSRGRRPFGKLAASLIHSDDGVRVLVRIDSDHGHVPVSLLVGG